MKIVLLPRGLYWRHAVKLSFQWIMVTYGVSADHLNKFSLVHWVMKLIYFHVCILRQFKYN